MKTKLTLQEKLRDLRDEKRLKLSDVNEATGIPTSTLQRFESGDDVHVSYQDVEVLTRFYGVSADYLFGLTDNRQYRNVEIDKLALSDKAIAELTSGKLNNRLLSEVIAHPDFPRLMSAVEVYIDRNVLPQMNAMNAMFNVVEKAIKDKFDVKDSDGVISILQEAVIDEDEYLLHRVSERFNALLKNMFDAHKKDAPPDEQTAMLQDMKSVLHDYPLNQEKEQKARWKMKKLASQLGLNLSALSDDETKVLMKALSQSEKYRQKRRHGGPWR